MQRLAGKACSAGGDILFHPLSTTFSLCIEYITIKHIHHLTVRSLACHTRDAERVRNSSQRNRRMQVRCGQD